MTEGSPEGVPSEELAGADREARLEIMEPKLSPGRERLRGGLFGKKEIILAATLLSLAGNASAETGRHLDSYVDRPIPASFFKPGVDLESLDSDEIVTSYQLEDLLKERLKIKQQGDTAPKVGQGEIKGSILEMNGRKIIDTLKVAIESGDDKNLQLPDSLQGFYKRALKEVEDRRNMETAGRALKGSPAPLERPGGKKRRQGPSHRAPRQGNAGSEIDYLFADKKPKPPRTVGKPVPQRADQEEPEKVASR
ncbi:hypothetical protein KJ903_00655 [Patescibacteria group bacterium]|nr:hypothetical protein [Patescibacteria group bacterium]